MRVLKRMWSALGKLYSERRHFALCWLLRNDELLQTLIKAILGREVDEDGLEIRKYTRGLLFNGYRQARERRGKGGQALFEEVDWVTLEQVFEDDKSFLNLPKPVRDYVKKLGEPNIPAFLSERLAKVESNSNFSKIKLSYEKVCGDLLQKSQGCFLGTWEKSVLDTVRPEGLVFLAVVPTEFVRVQKRQNYTSVYDCEGQVPVLVGLIFTQKVLTEKTKGFMRSLLSELFVAHPEIMRGAGKESFRSEMKGFGPFFNPYKKGKNKVSFYTHRDKIHRESKDWSTLEEFDILIDKYSHVDVINIILAFYLWWCPEVLDSFFAFSDPYLNDVGHDKGRMETLLGLKGPSAYQLYITKDYCSEMHVDADFSDFTLCYCSHPDSENGLPPVDFILADYGVRLPVTDGDVFAFRSSSVHGTAFRTPTAHAAYMGCVAINRPLFHLMRRRHRANT